MDRVGVGDGAAGAVVDRRFEFAAARSWKSDPLRQTFRLWAPWQMAEDGLMEVECVLQQKLVNGSAAGIGGAALGSARLAKPFWINIIAATWQQNSVHRGKQASDAVLALVQRNDDRHCPGGVQGGNVRRQGALVVFRVAAGRLRDGNADSSSKLSVSAVGAEVKFRFRAGLRLVVSSSFRRCSNPALAKLGRGTPIEGGGRMCHPSPSIFW